MKQEDTSPEDFDLVELGSVSEETRGAFGLSQENGELPFTRQIV